MAGNGAWTNDVATLACGGGFLFVHPFCILRRLFTFFNIVRAFLQAWHEVQLFDLPWHGTLVWL